MKDINKIKEVCVNPQLVHSEMMSVTEISQAMGMTYTQTKDILKEALHKVHKELFDLGFRKESLEVVLPCYGSSKRSFNNADY